MSKSLRALLVEDSEDDARLIVHALQTGGYEVEWERVDSPPAMQVALDRADWDVVLADYRMPRFSGAAALQQLKDTHKDIPFVLVSGKIGEETAVDALRAGASDFVMKDRLARLVPAVERELREARVRRERQSMETRLRLEQERFRALVEKSWEVISIADRAGWLIYSSPAIERVLGFPVEEFISRNFCDLVHPDDLGAVQEDFAEILKTSAATRRREFRCRHRDGSWRWVGANLTNLLDEPSVHGIVINYRDITERKRAEEALHRRERELLALVRQAPDIIAQFDRQQRCRYVNRAPGNTAGLLAGLSGDAGTAPDWSGKTGQILRRTIEQVFTTGQETTVEYEALDAVGKTTYCQTRLAPVLAPDGGVESVIAIARDVTSSHQLEEQYRQAQKMKAIGQLAGGIAHDFNNILTIIQMQSSLLLSKAGPDDSFRAGIRQIQEAANRAGTLTRQLLMFSRRQVKQARDVDLAEIIDPMVKLLRSTLGDDIALEPEFAAGLPLVNADPGMIEQALMNLAVNARDAMPDGGRLVIGLDAVEVDAARAAMHAVAPGRFVCLRVGDTGCGIPRENLSRLFEPFFTTKEIGKGTGLGLATVFGIVQQHQGWIEVESEVGKGTTFRVYLPALSVAAAPAAPAAPGAHAIHGGTETILIVEDDTAVRDVVRFVLEHYGYTVLDAASPAAALRIWKEKGPSIDLLVTDLIMPGGITGQQLADQLMAKRPALKIIYTSGYSNEVANQRLNLGPGREYLHKPYPAHDLAIAVRRCLDGS
jgi:PAS domain S-box-containing protein